MNKNRNSKKYAKMFLNAVGMDAAPDALKELKIAEALMQKVPDFRSLLVSPLFSGAERVAVLSEAGRMLSLSEQTVKFLGFLSENKAASAVGEVLEKAIAIYSERKARVKAVVITPAEIGADYEARLKESIRKITNKEVDIEYEIDSSLLGGLLVKVGSTMYDGTVKGQLGLLRDELVRG